MSELKKSLNFTQLVFYGVGTIVGAGIYSIIGSAADQAGAAMWLSFLLASLTAFITALSYAELVSALPKAGAEYQFLRAAFPSIRLLGFLAGLMIALNASATSATVALAFAGYLNVFVEAPVSVVAFCLLLVCTLLNIWGIRQATWVSIALIVVEMGGLLLFIGFGMADVKELPSLSLPTIDALPNIAVVTALVFFVYIGFEDVANLSQEAKQPTKDVPWALLLSVVITSVVYLLVAFTATAIGALEGMAKSQSPLEAAATQVAPWLGKTLGITALFATASTALISLISISRLLYGMAQGGDMPAALGKTLSKRQTPWVAALVLFAAACALLPLEQVKLVASVSSAGVLLVFIGVQAAMIALRYKKPDMKREFVVPLTIGKFPVLPAIGIVIAIGLLTQFEPTVYAVVAGTLLGGGVIYALMSKKCSREAQ